MSAAMLEPRPEIKTATRAFSAIVGSRPALAGAPGAGAALDRAAAFAGLDGADVEDRFAGPLECFGDTASITCTDNRDHADPAVEGAGQLGWLDRAARLEECEQAGQGPKIGIDDRVAIVRHNPRNILE